MKFVLAVGNGLIRTWIWHQAASLTFSQELTNISVLLYVHIFIVT